MNRLTRTTALTLLLITTQVEADNPTAHEVTTSEAPSLSETALSDAETAREKEQGTSDPSTTETLPLEEKPDPMDSSRRWVVSQLDKLSGGLDSFFVDMFFDEDISDQDVTGSRARISYRIRHEQGEPMEYKLGVGVNIVLPHTEDRLNLLIESEDETTDESGVLEAPENSSYSATLRFIIRESKRWKTTLDAGIRWGLPPDPYTRLRIRRPINFNDHVRLKFRQELSYYTQEGYGEETNLQFDYGLSATQAVRARVSSSYLLNDHFFKLRYGMGWYREVTHKFSYAIIGAARGNTEHGPTIYEYTFGVNARKTVYKDWMTVELFPHMLWANDNEWEPVPVITLKFQAEFSE